MIQQVAQQVAEIQHSFDQGLITADEYKELIGSMDLIGAISDQTASLEENIMYRQIILNAVQLAKAMA